MKKFLKVGTKVKWKATGKTAIKDGVEGKMVTGTILEVRPEAKFVYVIEKDFPSDVAKLISNDVTPVK